MTSYEREIGMILAKLDSIIEKLGGQNDRIDDHEARLRIVERHKNLLTGAFVVVNAGWAAIVVVLSKLHF